ncbi:transmembrane protein, putative (macronuclear) [Tetrahymena thermophila SB210]|uniref:Transmembrane protein, putative n=1 Tax=Tetrahymena thermophila (strain SB210) TaxID=312017 RepID=W7XJP1_TETTS|nr:transmembrane protein, putative [Tetrahymena thermophila SB210]EWS75736.1 transmembrane protein, putative [Tetrahymena thermophila SB210]|eukprot:XP_012651658.1 transmembrane protein, putative [Tetrahymena thermophila SB210]
MGLRGAIVFVSTIALTLTAIMYSDRINTDRQCSCDCLCRNCSLVRRTFGDLKKRLLG